MTLPTFRIETKDPIVRELFTLAKRRRLFEKDLVARTGYTRQVLEDARLARHAVKLPLVHDLAKALGLKLKLVPEETRND